jgi:hypothetical protein
LEATQRLEGIQAVQTTLVAALVVQPRFLLVLVWQFLAGLVVHPHTTRRLETGALVVTVEIAL